MSNYELHKRHQDDHALIRLINRSA